MRTFTCSDGRSHKFWNIDLQSGSLTVNYGRQGTAGQSRTRTFPDPKDTCKEHDKLVKEKLAKGYVETTPSAQPPAASLREALEAALVENPDDLAAHMAYADYLQEQGDPRGEFVQVQLALEDESKPAQARKALQAREKALWDEHGRQWLGELAPYLLDQKGMPEHVRLLRIEEFGYGFVFRRGWLDHFDAGNMTFECARVLARAPEARLLRQLVLRGQDDTLPEGGSGDVAVPENCNFPALLPLLSARNLGNVRLLQVGELLDADGYSNCHMNGEAAVGLVKLMPCLEQLDLGAYAVDVEQIFGLKTLHHLRVLQVYHARNYPLQRLAKNPSLGRLTHLMCFPHAVDDSDPYIRLADLRAVVRSPTLTALTHLQLRSTDAGDAGCAEIAASGILARLKLLDLRYGCITDAGARTLAACPDLKNLESLDVGGNALTAEGIEALEATGISVVADRQWESTGNAEDDYQNYLFHGDIE